MDSRDQAILRKHLSDMGTLGGKNRWKGVSKRKRRAHALMMVKARRKNGA